MFAEPAVCHVAPPRGHTTVLFAQRFADFFHHVTLTVKRVGHFNARRLWNTEHGSVSPCPLNTDRRLTIHEATAFCLSIGPRGNYWVCSGRQGAVFVSTTVDVRTR
jgi:hypothetical protein